MVSILTIQEPQMSQNNGTYMNTFMLVIDSYNFDLMSQFQKKIIPAVIPTRNVR